METPPTRLPPRLIAREMAAGFGMVSLVALATCGLLLVLIQQVSGLVMGMREEESAIRQGLALATAVREQYMHLAQALIEGDRGHIDRYRSSTERVSRGIAQIAPRVPPSQRWRVAALERDTRAMVQRFAHSPSLTLGASRHTDVVAEHRVIARLAERASRQADAIARAVESRMVHSHVLATRATRWGLGAGGVGALLVIALSIGFTFRLRAAVLRPLTVLTGAARRFGAGDFSARVGAVGRGELRAVAEAFDRMAEELAERERRLVHTERMAAIGQLAAGVAHELNNPIGIIRGYLKTMDPDGDIETLREELQILDEEAAQCQRIADDLLSYARPTELAAEVLAMDTFIDATVRRFRESHSAAQTQVVVDAEPCDVWADPLRLRQVLINLLLNAAQAAPEDSETFVRGRRDGDSYTIEVGDRGPGIAAEDQGRIFEPFFSRRKGGSGLGLAVCAGIVVAHGGAIAVRAREGGGSVFHVQLPLQRSTSDQRRIA